MKSNNLDREMILDFENLSVHEGPLILVNRMNPCVTVNSAPQLTKVKNGILLERRTARILSTVFMKLRSGGRILPVSGYRSREEQEEIFCRAVRESGQSFARSYVALPGCSEHQTGLAVDLADAGKPSDEICPTFSYTGIGMRFRKEALRFGFVERYPAGKEAVTGIGHEPWHFRYVGYPHSQLMQEKGMVLEEYLGWLQQFSLQKPLKTLAGGRRFEIFFARRGNRNTALDLGISDACRVSGDNMDGFIVTIRRETVLGKKGQIS